MEEGKDVRKYGMGKQASRWSKYGLRRFSLIPAKLVVAAVCGLGMFISAESIKGLATINNGSTVNPLRVGGNVSDKMFAVFGLLVGIVLACRYGWAVWYVNFKVPKGTLWNPQPPQENPLLPDAELLVRPSSSSAAPPAELLRAATETMEEKPEELLRAGTEHC